MRLEEVLQLAKEAINTGETFLLNDSGEASILDKKEITYLEQVTEEVLQVVTECYTNGTPMMFDGHWIHVNKKFLFITNLTVVKSFERLYN